MVPATPTTSMPSFDPLPSHTFVPFVDDTPTPQQTFFLSYSPNPLEFWDPTETPTPIPLECWQEGGKIITTSLRTVLLRLPLDYRVYLPPCYEEQPERQYAVLYLIHGQSYTDDQWDRLGVDETVDRLAASNEIQPFIIVMPRDRYGGQPTESNFGKVIVEELVPLIDTTYRTIAKRDFRAVGGLSRGAGWAVHLAISNWQTFGVLGAHSPAIFFTDAQRMRSWLDAIPRDSYPRIYMDIGDRDRPEILEAALWFENLLNEKDIPHEWHLFSGLHNEAYWRVHLEQYIRWYAANW